MDHTNYSVIYVDRRVRDSGVVQRDDVIPAAAPKATSGPWSDEALRYHGEIHGDVAANVQALLSVFQEVFLCTSGSSCRSKLSQVNDGIGDDRTPILVFIDMPADDLADESSFGQPPHSPIRKSNSHDPETGDDTFYGTALLHYIVSEIQYQNFSKLIVPIAAMCSSSGQATGTSNFTAAGAIRNSESNTSGNDLLDTGQVVRLLDAGAVDVLRSPFSHERILSCAMHGYRAQKRVIRDRKSFLAVKRGRKRSWVGIDEEKPYAYLREAMVSGLMDGICNPQNLEESFHNTRIHVLQARREVVSQAIGSWSFSAHDFSDDELLHAALLMLQHALSIPELEQWRIPTESLTAFLIATRTAYNSFVPYHNFRHVVDVLQAVFFFLLQIGTLPAYPLGSTSRSPQTTSPIAALLRPFDALTLLISAIGHDVGHPGVNNAFLVTLNAPLAQLYNDQSVLESFHCAAFSQILRRYWPASFQATAMRKLLISLILATDMGLHFDYMKKMGFCQEKVHENGGTDGWDGRLVEEQRTLVCSLLIKCADISNVARHFDVAAKWAAVLTDEFARQASMEKDLEIPSALFAPPIRDSIVELGKSQIGFMNLFALPLFQGVTDLLPAMSFSVDQMHTNKAKWEGKIEQESNKLQPKSVDVRGPVSPRSGSPLDLDQPARFPAGAVAQLNAKDNSASHPDSSQTPQSLQPPALDQANPFSRQPEPEEAVDTVSHDSAVLVTSPPQKPPTTTKTAIAGDSAHAAPKSFSRRKSSEKSSLPSSRGRYSQTTSPTNMACSPTTQGTSFLSVDSADKTALEDGTTSRSQLPFSPPASQHSEDYSVTPRVTASPTPTPPKTIRHRPSRWKINFWKARRKAQPGEPHQPPHFL